MKLLEVPPLQTGQVAGGRDESNKGRKKRDKDIQGKPKLSDLGQLSESGGRLEGQGILRENMIKQLGNYWIIDNNVRCLR